MSELKTTLTVNDKAIELTEYPEEFLTQTVLAAVATLKKVDEIKDLEVSFSNAKTTVTVNGKTIPLGPFPATVIAATFCGLVSALKGVDQELESFKIKIG